MKTKTYIITGATSGIGELLVKHFAKSNIVFAGYRSEDKIENLKKYSNNIIPFYIDYSKPETVIEATRFIKSKCNKIDTLINVAGCVIAGPIENISVDEIRRQFDVNVFGHLEITQNLIENLDGGRIINVSSMASFGVFPFVAPYCASKRCLDMLFNSLLIETKKNIKIISVKPGVIATPLWGKSINENSKNIENCSDYTKEMKFLIENARKNETKGLNVQKVVDVIIKADSARNPKLTYLVGNDAKFAGVFSKLPQNIVNKIIKLGIKLRIR